MLGKKMSSKGRMSIQNLNAQGARGSKVASPVSPDAPLVIPQVKVQESFKLLPKYSAALSRPHDDIMPAEDLDAIQLELEMLLSTSAQRYRVLKSELESCDKEDNKHKNDKKSKHIERPPSSPGKRKAPDDKRMKDGARYFGSQIKVAKLKSSAHSPATSLHTDDSMDVSHYQSSQRDNTKLAVPKNDIPNKFWLSVEPYCMPITQEDIKLLDDLMEEYSGALVPPIPELGPHYSTQWASEDLKEEQDNSNPNAKLNKRFTAGSSTDVLNMIKRGERMMGDGITGPLTQRLVSALLEENVFPTDNVGLNNTETNENNDDTANRTISMLKNGISIERRVKKELIEQGLLDPEDFAKSNEDEILAEIKRVRTELAAIGEYNHTELKKLHTAAKDEMKRLEVKRKLDVVDQEIVEMYKKIVIIKQKRRSLTKQERDEVFRLTEEQKRLSDQLESMPAPGLVLF